MDKSMSSVYLNRHQKEAVGLLSMGTFLEYFDLMIYVHMAVLLNELFFPKTDPHTAALLSAFSFCSTFVLRPVGALIFGYIGDRVGRKPVVISTTLMMAISCIIMANLPTYAQVGITASWLITICRIFQGLSSVGEIVGAKLYLTEVTRPPIQYPVVAIISIASLLGTVAALGISTFILNFGLQWRITFWIGGSIALIGASARTLLMETPDFSDAKRNIKNKYEDAQLSQKLLKKNKIYSEGVNKKISFAYFIIHCIQPICFYLIYIYCGNILKTTFGYTPNKIISHNFIISIVSVCWGVFFMLLSYRVYPLKITKTVTFMFLLFIFPVVYLLKNTTNISLVFLTQAFVAFWGTCAIPCTAIFYKHFPIFKRFTYSSMLYAIAHSTMYVVTSFGLLYLNEYFGVSGILILVTPITIGYLVGLIIFENMEFLAGNHPRSKVLQIA